MTGPEHYAESERLIEQARTYSGHGIEGDGVGESGTRMNEYANLIAAAQVHATLALSAATFHGALMPIVGLTADEGNAWMKALA